MTVCEHMSIGGFEPWGGAVDFFERLNSADIIALDYYFDELTEKCPLTETQINDVLWFEDEFLITEILGETVEDFYNRK